MKTSSKGQTPPGSRITRYRPTITGQAVPMRHHGLQEVHERATDGRCFCGVAWNLHPVEVLDQSSAKLAAFKRGLPKQQQRLAFQRAHRALAPNAEVVRDGTWVHAGSVPA